MRTTSHNPYLITSVTFNIHDLIWALAFIFLNIAACEKVAKTILSELYCLKSFTVKISRVTLLSLKFENIHISLNKVEVNMI